MTFPFFSEKCVPGMVFRRCNSYLPVRTFCLCVNVDVYAESNRKTNFLQLSDISNENMESQEVNTRVRFDNLSIIQFNYQFILS